ncbi:MAG: acyltransferase family protein [Candidatus Lokiarchaeota archaeon]|nr:acyltransferase family protein [Candidatus Lokiarchaeota archaeon]
MQRLKSIDIFRGLCMSWMFLGHLIDWWIKPEFFWLESLTFSIFDPIGASGFLFISGVSMALSYRNRMYRVEVLKEIKYSRVRLSYYLRASFLLIIALIYNLAIALTINDLSWIWTWFVLMTAAFSLLIVWPLFKISKKFRIIIGFFIWLIGQFMYYILVPFQYQENLQGVLYHIFYNDFTQDPLVLFFPFFLFGTVVGDIINDLNNNENIEIRRKKIKERVIFPIGVISLVLISIGALFNFPNFLFRSSFSWLLYALGLDLMILLILITLEEFKVFKTKKSYRVFFYFSYYSFTVYLGHNFLYLIFFESLDFIHIWIASLLTFAIFSVILRQIYKKWGWKASLKAVLGKLSYKLAGKIEGKISDKRKKGGSTP